MHSVVITGVSSGLGKATAEVLIGLGWRVFGSVRRKADADALRKEWGKAFVPLIFDVEDDEGIVAGAAAVKEALAGETLRGLVNNAGVSLAGPLLAQSVADFRKQIDVNLVGMFAVTRAFAPLLGVTPGLKGPRGRVVNISSMQ